MLHLCGKSNLRWAMPVLLLTGVSLALWGWGRSLVAQSQEPVAISVSTSETNATQPSSNAYQSSPSTGVSQPAASSDAVDSAADAAQPSSNAVQSSASTGVSQPPAVSPDPIDLARPPQDLGLDLLLRAAEPENPELAALRQQYVEAERESLRLAADYARQARAAEGAAAPPELAGIKQQLERSVQTAFDLRQRLQSGEVARLRERLQKVERRLETRSQLKDRIIAQRIEDLLNPDQRWDAGTGPEAIGPGPEINLLGTAPRTYPGLSVNAPYGPPLPTPVPAPIYSIAPVPESLPPEMIQAHVILRLVEMPSELALGLGLPQVEQGPSLLRDSAGFESAFSLAQSTGKVRIVAQPQLVAAMGRKAQLHIGGESADRLDVEVSPYRCEVGELQFSIDVKRTVSRSDHSTVAGAPNEQTFHAQDDLTLTPEQVAINRVDAHPPLDTDRWMYLLVQARPLHAGPPAAPTAAKYLPVRYATAPAVPPRAPEAAAPPATTDPWPRKLPSEYFNQRQQIMNEVTEQARQSLSQRIELGDDELDDVRIGLLVRQAEQRLALLTQEFDSQRQVYESQLQAQKTALDVAQQNVERLEAMYRVATVPESEVAQARAALAQAQAAYQQIENIMALFQSSREALASEEDIAVIVDEMKRAAELRRERLQEERKKMEVER